MQKQVTVALQTVCDLSMQDYVESEQSVDEQNKIADKIAELRDSLNPQQKQLLNQLLDDINEYYGAAEPPVRCGESHLSGLTEPPQFVY